MFYPLVVLFVLSLIYIGFSFKKYEERLFYILILCYILFGFVFFGLRSSSSGPDSQNYINLIAVAQSANTIEFLSNQYFTLLRLLSDNFSVWFVSTFGLMIVCFLTTARNLFTPKWSAFVFICMSFSYAYFDFFSNVLRQGLSLGVALIAFSVFFRSKLLSVSLLVIASLFHASAILYFAALIPAVLTIENKYYRHISFFIVSFLMLISFIGVNFSLEAIGVVDKVIEFLPVDMVSVKMLRSLSVYSEGGIGSISELNTAGKLRMYISLLLPIMFSFFYKGNSKYFKLFYSAYVVLVIVYLAMAYQSYSYRYAYMALALVPFLLAFIVQDVTKRVANFDSAFVIFLMGNSLYYFWPVVFSYEYSWVFM